MSFITNPSGSIQFKIDGAPAPSGVFYSADNNNIRSALFELRDVVVGSGSAGALTASSLKVSGNFSSTFDINNKAKFTLIDDELAWRTGGSTKILSIANSLVKLYSQSTYGSPSVVDVLDLYGGFSGSTGSPAVGQGSRISFKFNDSSGTSNPLPVLYSSIDARVQSSTFEKIVGDVVLRIANGTSSSFGALDGSYFIFASGGLSLGLASSGTVLEMLHDKTLSARLRVPSGSLSITTVSGTEISGALRVSGSTLLRSGLEVSGNLTSIGASGSVVQMLVSESNPQGLAQVRLISHTSSGIDPSLIIAAGQDGQAVFFDGASIFSSRRLQIGSILGNDITGTVSISGALTASSLLIRSGVLDISGGSPSVFLVGTSGTSALLSVTDSGAPNRSSALNLFGYHSASLNTPSLSIVAGKDQVTAANASLIRANVGELHIAVNTGDIFMFPLGAVRVSGAAVVSGTITGSIFKLERFLNLTDYSASAPADGDVWRSGTNILTRITGSTFKLNVSAYP